MTYVIPLLVLVVLVLVNAVLVAAEFAVVASRRVKLEAMAEKSAAARAVLGIVSDPRNQDRFIAIAQLGITLVTVGLGMYAEPTIAGWLYGPFERMFGIPEAAAHTLATVIVLSLVTYIHVVVGEMIPKAIALYQPERTSVSILPVMRLLQVVFAPGVWVLNSIAGWFLQLMKLPLHGGHHRLYTASELEMLVNESTESGAVEEDQRELIEAIFDFGEREVYQCMTPRPRVKGIPVTATAEEITELISTSKHSRFPVYDGDLDHIIGILHIKDFIRAVSDGRPLNIRRLVRRAPRVPLHLSSAKLLASFKRLRVHMAIVMDEYGGTEGIVTLEDLIEEVVGEVYDEHDPQILPEIHEQPDGTIIVEGEVQLEDFDEEYPGVLTAGDANTVGGLVIEELGRAPVVGDTVEVDGAVLTVEAVDGLAIARVHVQLPPEEALPPAAGDVTDEPAG